MIIGMKTSPFSAMNELFEQFILTGSRHFGGYNHNSDYDFFTPYSQELCDKLYDLGFRTEDQNEGPNDLTYTDKNCVIVMKHMTEPIHIQLVRDFELKKRVQNHLKGFPFYSIEKKHRKVIWDWAFSQV